MLLQFQFHVDTSEGRRMENEIIGYTTLDLAMGHAETMLKVRSFYLGKANLCIIKDQDGHVLREVRVAPSE